MTFLRFLAALLPFHVDGPLLVVNVAEHVGPRYSDAPEFEDDEPCPHHAGTVAYQLVAADLRDLFEEVAHYKGNGASDTEAADHGMATLMLRSIESRGDAA